MCVIKFPPCAQSLMTISLIGISWCLTHLMLRIRLCAMVLDSCILIVCLFKGFQGGFKNLSIDEIWNIGQASFKILSNGLSSIDICPVTQPQD